MSIKVACIFCDKNLVISDALAGKQIRCPACKNPFLINLHTEILKESVEDDSKLPDVEPVKKRKKKKNSKSNNQNEFEDKSILIWWTFGSLGLALLIYILYYSIVHGTSVLMKYYAINLLVMCPISLIMFFATVFFCNTLLGEIEIGDIHSAIFKAIFVVLCANFVSLLPFGFFLSLATWFILLISIFHFDPWEARILVVTNWALNFSLKLVVFSVLISNIMGGIGNSDENNLNPGTGVSKPEIKPRQVAKLVTKANFEDIGDGMSYGQVVKIIGSKGELNSSNYIEGVPGVMPSISTKMYSWTNFDGSGMNIILQNDQIKNKAQFGLE